jgi:RNA polymerase sigma factor (sigma-70 family)
LARLAAALGEDITGEPDPAVRAALVRALSLLDEREGQIIRERLLSDEPRSLREIGEDLGVSRERVRQLEARALAKMRGVFEQAGGGQASAAAA